MNKEQLQADIIKHGGYILSDGTLNLTHLLPKAYDLMANYKLSETIPDVEALMVEILECFKPDGEDMIQIRAHGLFFAQYHGMCKVVDEKQIEASEIWNESVYNMFQNLSPDGYSYGSSEGDGACIGWFKYEQEDDADEDANEEVEHITFDQLKNNKEWSEAVIVFKQESFGVKRREFTLTECSYKIKSTAKYFDSSMIGNSLIGDCLDSKDLGVRLDIYMHRLPSDGARWEVDYCYIINQ